MRNRIERAEVGESPGDGERPSLRLSVLSVTHLKKLATENKEAPEINSRLIPRVLSTPWLFTLGWLHSPQSCNPSSLTAIQAAAPSFGLTCGLDALNTVLKCIYSVFGFSGMCVPPR